MTYQTIPRVAAVLALAVLIAGCTGEQGGETKDADSTLVVGAILSKTGPAAAYGGDADEGARLAIKEINARGDAFSIRYLSRDDKSDKTEATKVARTLMDIERVHVVLGPAISPSAVAVGKLAEERGTPIVCTSATLDAVTVSDEYDRRFVFRVCFNDSYQGEVLARFAYESLGKKNAAIIFDKTLTYSIGLAARFREVFESLGGKVTAQENYSVGDADYSSLVDKVAMLDTEVLFIPGWDENVGPMIRQSGGKWDKFVLLGGDGWPTPKLLELAGGNIPEAYASTHYAPGDPDPRVDAFRKSYQAEYGRAPSPFAALGYDAIMLIHDAARRAPSWDGSALQSALMNSHNVPLVTGNLTFDENRNPKKDVIMVKILPVEFVFHERVKPKN